MTGQRPKSPGWYPDPDIHPGSSRTLRYWNGRHWTDRRRPSPHLRDFVLDDAGRPEVQALEGPARTVELPALAGEMSTGTREGPSGRSDTRDRSTSSDVHGLDLPLATGQGAIPPLPPAKSTGGGDGSGDDGSAGAGKAGKTKRLRRWLFFSVAAVLAAVAVILAGEAMRPPPVGPRVLTDNRFVTLANTDCATTLPTLRPPDGGQMPSAITPAQAAAQADKAATGLDALADQLAAIPAAAADKAHINGWLDGWHQYAAIGHQFAADLRLHGAGGKEPPYLTTAAQLSTASDRFSQANGLTKCLFAYAYQANPSDF
jgi:hypothetical protein